MLVHLYGLLWAYDDPRCGIPCLFIYGLPYDPCCLIRQVRGIRLGLLTNSSYHIFIDSVPLWISIFFVC